MRKDQIAYTPEQFDLLKIALKKATGSKDLYYQIVNAPFADKLLSTSIDLGIIVLLLVNKKKKRIDRVALSDTELAQEAVRASAKPFHDIHIPLNTEDNIIVESILEKEPKITEDWKFLFKPALTAEEARRNQASASIECSLVHPLKHGVGGALIFSFYQPRKNIETDHFTFADEYCELVNKQLTKLKSSKQHL